MHEDLLVAIAQRPRYGRGLDELRPVADDGEDLHAEAAPTTEVDQSITDVGRTT